MNDVVELTLLKMDALYRRALRRIDTLEDERDAAIRETGALRDGITKAIGMPWTKIPQIGGGVTHVCPDDQAIIATCAQLARTLASCNDKE